MIKNIVIVSLIIVCVCFGFLGINEHNEKVDISEILQYERNSRSRFERDVQEAGMYLYNALGEYDYVEDAVWLNSKSLCNESVCVTVDQNGDIFVIQY